MTGRQDYRKLGANALLHLRRSRGYLDRLVRHFQAEQARGRGRRG